LLGVAILIKHTARSIIIAIALVLLVFSALAYVQVAIEEIRPVTVGEMRIGPENFEKRKLAN